MPQFGVTPLSTTVLGSNQFPVSAAWVPNSNVQGNLTAVEGMAVNTDTNNFQSTAIRMGLKDGDDATQGSLNDAAVTGDTSGSISAKLRGLNKTFAQLQFDGSNFLKVNIAAGTVAASQSGTWNINNISGTISLPTGAATDATVAKLNISPSTILGSNTGPMVQGSVTTSSPTYVTGNINPLSLTTAGALRTDASATTQPISAASLPLPTGAATSAKQPALGTAGSASTDVLTVQGIASMTALKVDGSGVTQPVSGTITANAGTGNFTVVQATGSNLHAVLDSGSTTAVTQATASNLNAQVVGSVASGSSNSGNPVKLGGAFNSTQPTVTTGQIVDAQMTSRGAQIVATGVDAFAVNASQSGTWNITNISGTVSLPTGAATSTKQPALGTAGSASSDVITVQGIASMTALKVDGSGVTQPVSGTVTANAGTGTFNNQQTNITADYDTSAGTQNLTMFGVALPASGGAVAGGTSSNPLKIDPTGTTTQPVSGTVTVTQSTASNLKVDLSGTAANATAIKVDGSAVTQPVSGTVTANIGTTNGLALDTSVNGILLSQGSTTSGQKGSLIQGAVTTSAPTYTTAQTSPLSLDTSGLLRVSIKDTPSNTNNLNVALAASSATVTVTATNLQTNLNQIAGSAIGTAASGIMKVGLTDGTGNAITSTSNAIDVNIKSGGGSGFSVTDEAAWTAGTSAFVPSGGVFNDSAAALTSGQQGSIRLTNNRAIHVNLRDASANQLLGSKTSANSIPVVIASDQGAIPVSQSGTWTVQPGNTQNSTAWLTQDAADGPVSAGTAASKSILSGIVYNTSAPTPTNGQQVAMQADQAGNIRTFPGISLTTLSAWNSSTGTNATQTIFTNSGASAVLIQLDQTTTITGGAITFEANYDGTNWVTPPANTVLDPTSATYAQIANPYTLQASTNKPFLICNNGWQGLRIRLSTVISGTGAVTPYYALLAFNPVEQSIVYSPTAANFQVTVGAALPAGSNTIGAVTQASGPWTNNLTQIGGTSVVTGGANGLLAVAGPVASGSSNADNPLKVGGAYNSTQPTVTTGQIVDAQYTARGAAIVATGTDAFAVNASQTGSWTVTANAGTNLNTSALALDTSVNGILLSQGSTTSGQKGSLIQGAVTTSAPSYTTAQTSPLSLTTAGALRVDGSAATQPVSGTVTANIGTSGSLALDATVAKLNVAQSASLGSNTGPMIQGSVTTNAPSYSTGNINPLSLDTSGLLRVSLKDTPANTNNLNVTLAASSATVTVTATNLQTNTNQIAGSAISTAASGVQKVGIVGNAGATLDSTVGAGTAPTNAVVTGSIYNSSAPAPTPGQAMALQADQAGSLRTFPGIALATLSTWNSGTSLNATQNIFTNSGAAAVLVQLTQTTTLTAGAITFEVSYDGSNWSTIPANTVLDPTSTTFAQINLPYTVQASTNKQFLLNMNGAQGLRIKLSTQITGSGTVTPNYALLSDSPADAVIALSPTAANFQTTATQSGTWTMQPGNTANTTPWLATINQGGNSATVTGSNALKVDGSAVTQPVNGTITANAGTNLNTSALALETGGNLAASKADLDNIKTYTSAFADTSTTGTVTNDGDVVSIALPGGQATVLANILMGTLVGTLLFEASPDSGTTWVSVQGNQAGTSTIATSTTAAGVWRIGIAGFTNFRIRLHPTVSGASGTITVRVTQGVHNVVVNNTTSLGQAVMANSAPVAIASDQSAVKTKGDYLEVAGNAAGSVTSTSTPLISATDVSAYKWMALQITGTWTMSLQFQASNDNANWVATSLQIVDGTSGTGQQNHTNSNNVFYGPVAFRYFRVMPTSWTSNASCVATLELYTSPSTPTLTNVGANQLGTWTVQPGNTANTTPWLMTINQGSNSATVTGSNALKVDGSAVTQPVSGTVSITANSAVNVAQVGGTNVVTGGASGLLAVGGPVASGASNADNPVKTGGVYNSTQPTVTTGQIVDLQATSRGALIVATGTDTLNTTVNTALPAGSNIIGKVGIDQTTIGTTNGVSIVNNNTGSAIAAEVTAPKRLRVQIDSTQVFYDAWDSGTVDTVYNWNAAVTGGNGTSTPSSGQEILSSGTSANGYAYLTSKNKLQPVSPGYLQFDHQIQFTYPLPAHTYAYWGAGTVPATPTSSAPLTDAVAFELATNGKMSAVTYAGGTRNSIQDLSSSTGNSTQPADANVHKYEIYMRGDNIFWLIDNQTVASISTGALGPNTNLLPIMLLSGTDATGASSAQQLTSAAVYVGDTSKSFSHISDPTHPQYAATVKPGSTAAVAADPSLVVGVSPNSPLPTGSNTIGAVTQASGPWTSNITQIAGSSISTAATGIQKVGIVGNTGATIDSTVAAGTAPTNAIVAGAVYNTSAPAPTNGQAMALQADQAGNMRTFPSIALATLAAWNSSTSLNATQNIFTNSGAVAVLVQLTQTTTLTAGAITFEVTYDGSNWSTIPANCVLDPTSTTFAQISLPYTVQASTNKAILINSNGMQGLRIKLSTQITGTGTVTPNYALLPASPADTVVALSPTAANFNATVTQSGTWTVQPGNTANSTAWLVQDVAGTSGGSTASHTMSAASTNATSLKNSSGMVYGLSISNANASARYFKLYNKASSPSVGTDTPVLTLQIPGNGTVIRAYPVGLVLGTGIAWACTGGISDSDTTAIGANDCSIDIDYK